MLSLLLLAAAPALLPPTVSDDACALDATGAVLCDSHDPVLADMMWDALDVPDCTYAKGCKFADGWEVRATALAYLDGDFARFTAYLDDEALTRKTIARRLEERRARKGR